MSDGTMDGPRRGTNSIASTSAVISVEAAYTTERVIHSPGLLAHGGRLVLLGRSPGGGWVLDVDCCSLEDTRGSVKVRMVRDDAIGTVFAKLFFHIVISEIQGIRRSFSVVYISP